VSWTAPYGTWPSPLGAADLVEGALSLAYPTCAGGRVHWQEGRPLEGGRVALVSRDLAGGDEAELLPSGFSARTTVHEYGGRAWAVGPQGAFVVSSNFTDQRLWLLRPSEPPVPLTPEPSEAGSARFGCPVLSPDGRWAVAVRERHEGATVANDLVALALGNRGRGLQVIAEGHDFYSSPVFSPDGRQLAYLCWDHPNMPWDCTELRRARFSDGRLEGTQAVVPSEAGESVLQPGWGPDGHLVYISDRSGWWNLYREDGEALAPMEADFAGPPWALGDSDYAFLASGALVATWRTGGTGYLGEVRGGKARAWELPYAAFAHLAPAADAVLAVAGGPTVAPELVRVEAGAPGAGRPTLQVLRRSRPPTLAPEWLSVGQPFSFPTQGGERAHGVYYPPRHAEATAPPGERPPLIVTSHGGPTSAASRALDLRVQFWTTRGFAVADVDYRGSTGYGRQYRRCLEGRWGLADAEDCAAAASWLVRSGRADPSRVVARGSSASGLTVLAALARQRIFRAGTVLYGVADLARLAASTHKFESHYIERLVPEADYAARSPLHLAGAIAAPVLFVHGLEDRVVPPEQSRSMVAELRSRGVPAVLVEVAGEGHGFRRAETLARVQEVELAFYGQVLGFAPSGDLSRAEADLAAGRAGTCRLDGP